MHYDAEFHGQTRPDGKAPISTENGHRWGVQQYIPFLRVAIPFFTIKAMKAELSRQLAVALYVVAMAGVIVGVDFAFFRNRLLERLTVNIGIVLVFAAFYLRFLRRP